jgi:chromosome condensin MukBEF MukE localization factor
MEWFTVSRDAFTLGSHFHGFFPALDSGFLNGTQITQSQIDTLTILFEGLLEFLDCFHQAVFNVEIVTRIQSFNLNPSIAKCTTLH